VKLTRFPTLKSKEICQNVLKKHLEKVTYNYETIPELTKVIANEILAEAKSLLVN
jgi:hypothetical protein